MNRYTRQLIQLQPPGRALPTDASSDWVKLLDALAAEFERVHQRIDALTIEILLQGGVELLDDWERALGLPDICVRDNPPTDPDLRRQRIRTKLAETGGQSQDYFIQLANQLGLSASITVWEPFQCGLHGCGDPIGGGGNRLVWQMNFPGEPDAQRLALVKCIVRESAPAHTHVVFSIGGEPEHVTIFYNGQIRHDAQVRHGA